MPISLQTPLVQLKKVGPKYSERLKKVGLETIQDLFFYLPCRYENLTDLTPLDAILPGQKVVIQATVNDILNSRSPRKRMLITQASVNDNLQNNLRVIWFNQPFIAKILRPGHLINLSGKVKLDNQGLFLSSPSYEIIDPIIPKPNVHTGRIIPIYHETTRLSSRYLRYLIQPLLYLTNYIPDCLPSIIKQKYKLLNLDVALKQIHFPDNLELAQQARQRLSFDEMLLIQLYYLKQKNRIKQLTAPSIPFDLETIKKFVRNLPFTLTNAQRRAAWEIFQDLQKNTPMNRLIEGDVGSGKTVVATMAALIVSQAGYQVAIMAPTAILAQQHFKELSQLLKIFKIKIGLLTSDDSQITLRFPKITHLNKKTLLNRLSKKQIQIVIGTHALIQEKVKLANPGLIIIDEQHRFGVNQRSQLIRNSCQPIPHFLSMTATPIPRSLALTIYSDLDLSLLDEMPHGRQTIITQIINDQARSATYQFVRGQIRQGRQAFVICPRIESSTDKNPPPKKSYRYSLANAPKTYRQLFCDTLLKEEEIKAVIAEYKKLSEKIFPDLKIAMLHGKLNSQEKQKIMTQFKAGKIDLLVATSVIEVGIDVPNATIMMIEGAERFGLAQLHQFRGRVGRGQHQSYCFIFTTNSNQQHNQRLKALITAKNGFELAEKDLEIRGPGQFFGASQSGLPDLAMQALSDPQIIQRARQAAQDLLNDDPQIKKYPLLKTKLEQFRIKIHWE